MYEATFTIEGQSELLFGAPITTKKKDNETHDQLEERCWRERINKNKAGQAIVRGPALMQGLESAAKFLGRRIPGEGKKTYTQRFKSGVMVPEDIVLSNGDGKPLLAEKIEGKWIFVPSDGTRGSGKRVWRCFPKIEDYGGKGTLIVFDGKIDETQLTDHLVAVGRYVGFGPMRVETGNPNGRWSLTTIEFKELA